MNPVTCGISKEVDGGSTINCKGRGKCLAGDIVEKYELKMKKSAQIKIFCRNIWVVGKVGSLGNNTSTSRVVQFGDIIGKTIIYP